MRIPVDAETDKCPHVFLMADSPWDPSTLDNKFCDAVTEIPEVKQQCDGADPCIDGHGFLCTQEDDKPLFHAEDATAVTAPKPDMCHNALSKGITHCDGTETMVCDRTLMMHFETVVAKLSAAPN